LKKLNQKIGKIVFGALRVTFDGFDGKCKYQIKWKLVALDCAFQLLKNANFSESKMCMLFMK